MIPYNKFPASEKKATLTQ